jgi:hypothetical protein
LFGKEADQGSDGRHVALFGGANVEGHGIRMP